MPRASHIALALRALIRLINFHRRGPHTPLVPAKAGTQGHARMRHRKEPGARFRGHERRYALPARSLRIATTLALRIFALASLGACTSLRSFPRKRESSAFGAVVVCRPWVPAFAGTNGGRSRVRTATFVVAVAAAVATLAAAPARAGNALPPGFVFLADVAPAILQDMRYAGPDNFTGRPVPGYAAPECILRAEVAAALARAQAELAAQSLALKVYDCYRPAAAVRAFVAWAHDGRPAGASKRFFPALDKRALFARGYISARSRHSTGTAVDLTLVPLPTPSAPPFDPRAPYADCTAPAHLRAPDNSLDMGTGYDCFDEKSHTRSGAIGAEARRRRDLLVAVLRRHGLHNYPREWWHFSFYGAGRPPARDFPVTARPSSD